MLEGEARGLLTRVLVSGYKHAYMTKRIPDGTSVLSVLTPDEVKAHLEALALQWSAERGEPITRSDVMRALLVEGIERNPVDAEHRAAAAKGRKPQRAVRGAGASRAHQILRVVDTSEEGTTSPRGFHGDPRSRGQGAHEQLTDIAA